MKGSELVRISSSNAVVNKLLMPLTSDTPRVCCNDDSEPQMHPWCEDRITASIDGQIAKNLGSAEAPRRRAKYLRWRAKNPSKLTWAAQHVSNRPLARTWSPLSVLDRLWGDPVVIIVVPQDRRFNGEIAHRIRFMKCVSTN